ncbi:Vegetative incompatibility protein [Drechslerella dactyloides]|uniref:Vegetative incompatibility protein n=1 Tax=Drechslerella dactyloides TaxID=74499 RepID=A0AAD6IZ90_DREDA|nr:Vegetative incompatibility protein [Drechslerella dactyloides]
MGSHRPLTRDEYAVGWICAIEIELTAALAVLDEQHTPLAMLRDDPNIYHFGRIDKHNVVITCLPAGRYGISQASVTATRMLHSFPKIRFGLMVGVGGGAPSTVNDIRLGDIVVSQPTGSNGGVIQYDFGKAMENGEFIQTGLLNAPPSILLNALTTIKATDPAKLGERILHAAKEVGGKDSRLSRPQRTDILFQADYNHVPSANIQGLGCSACDAARVVRRPYRAHSHSHIFYGTIASGNQVMKDGLKRDNISTKIGALCFEMEAAGLMNDFPCLVIRGICDYSDGHKNKEWQPYAAVVAALYAKELLFRLPTVEISEFENNWNRDLFAPPPYSSPSINESEKARETHKQQLKYIQEVLEPCSRVQSRVQEDFERCVSTAMKGTGNWLYSEPLFQAWKSFETVHPLLWLQGGPGAGKSHLSSQVIEHLTKDSSKPGPQQTWILYFFCRNDNADTITFEYVLKTLAWQLATVSSVYAQYIYSIYEFNKSPAIHVSRLWQKLFVNFITQTESIRLYIVLDGLDEAIKKSIDEFLMALKSSLKPMRDIRNIRILVSGRPEIGEQIGTILDSLPPTIMIGAEKNTQDLRLYVRRRMRESIQLKRLEQRFKEQVTEKVLQSANGMFLYVSLMMDEIRSTNSKQQILRMLDRLPKGLSAAWEMTLQRYSRELNEAQVQILVRLICWVLVPERSISVETLRYILSVTTHDRLDVDRETRGDDDYLGLKDELQSRYSSLFLLNVPKVEVPWEGLTLREDGESDNRQIQNPDAKDDASENSDTDFESQSDSTDRILEDRDILVTFRHASLGEFFRARQALAGQVSLANISANQAEVYFTIDCLEECLGGRHRVIGWMPIESWYPHFMRIDASKVALSQKIALLQRLRVFYSRWEIGHCQKRQAGLHYDIGFFAKLKLWLHDEDILSCASRRLWMWMREIDDEDQGNLLRPLAQSAAAFYVNTSHTAQDRAARFILSYIKKEFKMPPDQEYIFQHLSAAEILKVAQFARRFAESDEKWRLAVATQLFRNECYDDAGQILSPLLTGDYEKAKVLELWLDVERGRVADLRLLDDAAKIQRKNHILKVLQGRLGQFGLYRATDFELWTEAADICEQLGLKQEKRDICRLAFRSSIQSATIEYLVNAKEGEMMFWVDEFIGEEPVPSSSLALTSRRKGDKIRQLAISIAGSEISYSTRFLPLLAQRCRKLGRCDVLESVLDIILDIQDEDNEKDAASARMLGFTFKLLLALETGSLRDTVCAETQTVFDWVMGSAPGRDLDTKKSYQYSRGTLAFLFFKAFINEQDKSAACSSLFYHKIDTLCAQGPKMVWEKSQVERMGAIFLCRMLTLQGNPYQARLLSRQTLSYIVDVVLKANPPEDDQKGTEAVWMAIRLDEIYQRMGGTLYGILWACDRDEDMKIAFYLERMPFALIPLAGWKPTLESWRDHYRPEGPDHDPYVVLGATCSGECMGKPIMIHDGLHECLLCRSFLSFVPDPLRYCNACYDKLVQGTLVSTYCNQSHPFLHWSKTPQEVDEILEKSLVGILPVDGKDVIISEWLEQIKQID